MPDGLLLIDKPVGLRSTECVARVKRVFGRGTRVGHAGTLDSTASGLLIVLLGTATRLSDYVMRLPKVYEAVIKLGSATDTCDYSGKHVFYGDAAKADEPAFDRLLYSFLGERMQLPPEISALKVDGKPSHRLARAGVESKLSARPVTVTSVKRCSPLADGEVKISVTCGKGTYIRSIVRDIGTGLGCGAHILRLRRLSIGQFSVSDACRDSELPQPLLSRDLLSQSLLSIREVGFLFHRFLLTETAERSLSNGLCVSLSDSGRYIPGRLELRSGLCVEGKNMIGFADIFKKDMSDSGTFFLKPRTNIVDFDVAGIDETRTADEKKDAFH